MRTLFFIIFVITLLGIIFFLLLTACVVGLILNAVFYVLGLANEVQVSQTRLTHQGNSSEAV